MGCLVPAINRTAAGFIMSRRIGERVAEPVVDGQPRRVERGHACAWGFHRVSRPWVYGVRSGSCAAGGCFDRAGVRMLPTMTHGWPIAFAGAKRRYPTNCRRDFEYR